MKYFRKLILAVQSRLKIILFKVEGAEIGNKVKFFPGVSISRNLNKVKIGDHTAIDRYTQIIITLTDSSKELSKIVEIGKNVYINCFSIIDASEYIRIGDGVLIGPNSYITDHDHKFQNLDKDTPIGELPVDGKPTIIEDNVWLGSNVVVLKGITIGRNSIIGAGSVVTKNVPPDSVAVGNPCKVIKAR